MPFSPACPHGRRQTNSFRFLRGSLTLLLALLATVPGGVEAAEPDGPLAFPTAEGYGRFAKGGRGGDVYHVTHLEDSGPGSLREGLLTMTGPRTIVFDTGGTIQLKSSLKVEEKSFLTIAGQTAPGDGITIRDQNVSFLNCRHLVVRYLRFRLGDENKEVGGPDTLTVNYCDNAIFDHLSLSWGIDGNQDVRGCKNYTFQWCILSEALNESLHDKGAHAMCGSFRAPLSNYSIHHNLFATSRDRHPTIGGSVKEPEWIIDFRNNVIYNWSGAANVCDNGVNLINNYFKPGPETPVDRKPIALKTDLPDKGRGHMSGNYFEKRSDLTANNYLALDMERWLGPESKYKYDGTVEDWKVEQPFDLGPHTPATQTATEAYTLVLEKAGASLVRDEVDKRVMEDVRQGAGKLLNSQSEVGGWPDLDRGTAPSDTDRDGMPDRWEEKNGLNPKDPEDRNGDGDADGYTHLEEYLNTLVESR
jgi:hypothetical protein